MRTILYLAIMLAAVGCTTLGSPGHSGRSGGDATNLCVGVEPVPPHVSHPARRVKSVFIDLDGSEAWRNFFDAHDVDTVVVQHIVGDSGGIKFDNTDEAISLLREAPANVRIYMGVVYEHDFYASSASESELRAAADEDIRVARQFWSRLTLDQKNRIAGWYLGREIHNFRGSTEQRRFIREYLVRAGRGLPERPEILISPYFVPLLAERPDVLNSEETADLFAYIVTGTPVTSVLLQDGVGARNERGLGCAWTVSNYLPIAAHYTEVVARKLPSNVKLWSNVEAFGELSDATSDRVAHQLAAVPPSRPMIVFAYRECARTGVCQRR